MFKAGTRGLQVGCQCLRADLPCSARSEIEVVADPADAYREVALGDPGEVRRYAEDGEFADGVPRRARIGLCGRQVAALEELVREQYRLVAARELGFDLVDLVVEGFTGPASQLVQGQADEVEGMRTETGFSCRSLVMRTVGGWCAVVVLTSKATWRNWKSVLSRSGPVQPSTAAGPREGRAMLPSDHSSP